MQSIDWSRSALGPASRWPAGLRTALGLVLHSRQPMFLYWGPEFTQFYNDASLDVMGDDRHPAAMGQLAEECWRDAWPILAPQLQGALLEGRASENVDQLVPLVRGGRLEERYWTYGCSPVPGDDGSIGGVLVVATHTTDRVLEKRRAATIRALIESTSEVTERCAAYGEIANALADRAHDFPFAAVCAKYPGAGTLDVVECVGISREAFDACVRGPLERHLLEGSPLGAKPGAAARAEARTTTPTPIALAAPLAWNAPWNCPCPAELAEFVVQTISDASGVRPSIVVVLGLSPGLSFDAAYRAHVARIRGVVEAMSQRIDGNVIRTMSAAERDSLLLQAPFATALMTGPEHVFRLANPLFCELVGRRDLVGKSCDAVFPELSGSELPAILDAVLRTGKAYTTEELRVPSTGAGTAPSKTATSSSVSIP